MRKVILFILALLLIPLFWIGLNWYSELSVDELCETYCNEDSRWIDIDGLQVHYRDEGSGLPVILIHGTFSSLHTWETWVDQTLASDQKIRMISLDIPGFGLTGPNLDGDYSIAAYRKFIDRFAEEMKIDSFVIAGNSLGGQIAWTYAGAHPDKILGTVLLDPAGMEIKNVSTVFKLARSPLLSNLVTRVTPKSLVHSSLSEVFSDENRIPSGTAKRYHDLQRRDGNRKALVQRLQSTWVDELDLLEAINSPTLLIWGESDNWIPVEQASIYQEKIEHVVLKTFECGHVPQEEMAEESVEVFLDFTHDIQQASTGLSSDSLADQQSQDHDQGAE